MVGRPWSARPICRERWRDKRGRERSQTNKKYCMGGGVVLHMDVWVDSGRAHLWLEVCGVEDEKRSWEEARDDKLLSRSLPLRGESRTLEESAMDIKSQSTSAGVGQVW